MAPQRRRRLSPRFASLAVPLVLAQAQPLPRVRVRAPTKHSRYVRLGDEIARQNCLSDAGVLAILSLLRGPVAQLVEQRIENPRVGGSIPPQATNCIEPQES
jgi:hypothetical protein